MLEGLEFEKNPPPEVAEEETVLLNEVVEFEGFVPETTPFLSSSSSLSLLKILLRLFYLSSSS